MSEPTFSIVPDGDEATGQDCCDLAAAYSVPLDPWQQNVIRGILRERDGTWSSSQAGLVVARQNGKGQILTAIELFGLFALGENILHTAHSVKTSSDAFRRLWRVIQAHADLSRRVRRQSEMTGAEFVELDSGARIAFSTRSASAGRGLSLSRVIVDEAEDCPAAEVAALAPTVFSRPRAQSLYFGTAPSALLDSESFRTMRQAAHAGLNPRLCWFEWCAEYGSDIDDQDMWVRVNPAVQAGRVALQAIIDDRAVLPIDAFKSERVSMWVPQQDAETLFDPADWDRLADPDSLPVADIAIGVDTPPSRDSSTVCVAGRRSDGRISVEWYRTDPGVAWVPPWVAARLTDRVRAVVIDERGALAEADWAGSGVRPTLVGAQGAASAAGLLYDGITEAQVRHRGQLELSRGVLAAKQRPIRESFGWDRKSPGSSVLIAASLAVFGVTVPRPVRPRRGERRERRATLLM